MQTRKKVSYKGRAYHLIWVGPTKFGRKAKLAFLDGSKEFWVAAEAIEETPESKQAAAFRREDRKCEICGGNKYRCGHRVGW